MLVRITVSFDSESILDKSFQIVMKYVEISQFIVLVAAKCKLRKRTASLHVENIANGYFEKDFLTIAIDNNGNSTWGDWYQSIDENTGNYLNR